MIIFDHFLAIFDAKHIYDPANPFARDDKIAKAHSLNPAFVQFMQEEQKVEVSFLPKSESWFWFRNFSPIFSPNISGTGWLQVLCLFYGTGMNYKKMIVSPASIQSLYKSGTSIRNSEEFTWAKNMKMNLEASNTENREYRILSFWNF